MDMSEQAMRLRIFIGESDKHHHQPLYHAIVMEARKHGLAGATVMRALEGYGLSSRIHTANLLDLSSDLPIVIEIVDSQERLDAFLPVLDSLVDSGLVTIDPVTVVHYRHRHQKN